VYHNYPKVKAPTFKTTKPKFTMTVKKSTSKIRPFVVCAVLRDITFDEISYKSFLDLQAKLHDNICRHRKLVAIGTHDLDKISGPNFVYSAEDPDKIEFVPLIPKFGQKYTAKKLLEFYRDDVATAKAGGQGRPLKQYTDIIFNSDVYPVIRDSNDVVLSLPPIINGDHSKMSKNTKNVFVECTATDETKANIVLNMMVTMFSQYCKNQFEVEQVNVIYEDDPKNPRVTPNLSSKKMFADIEYINTLAGTPGLDATKICHNLGKMCLVARPSEEKKGQIEIEIPPIRPDVLHACDIAEDCAIGFGYGNLKTFLPPTNTVGKQQPINYLTELLRSEIGLAGFQEVLTLGLNSVVENFTFLRKQVTPTVELSNPITTDFQICRTSLLPGILRTLSVNIGKFRISQGLRAFEISDVVYRDDDKKDASGTGTYNRRKFCAVYVGPTAGFEIIHGLVDHFMSVIGVAPEKRYVESDVQRTCVSLEESELVSTYELKDVSDPTYFEKYCADIYVQPFLLDKDGNKSKAIKFGTMGVLHPEVVSNFGIEYPGSALEIDIDSLLSLVQYNRNVDTEDNKHNKKMREQWAKEKRARIKAKEEQQRKMELKRAKKNAKKKKGGKKKKN
jgi:phenylalanyl-tRNA synthetase beta chain